MLGAQQPDAEPDPGSLEHEEADVVNRIHGYGEGDDKAGGRDERQDSPPDGRTEVLCEEELADGHE